jgi:hypothetical protein
MADTGVIAVTGGVDTHLDTNMAAALDGVGGQLGTKEFPTTTAGYRALHRWLESFGTVVRVGVEGTGSYGAGLARYLASQGVEVIEVDRPNRQNRRRRGKSDPVDALSAARAALSGDASGLAKARNGAVEAIRVLRVARSSARHDRTEALNQMRSLVSTAPDELREQLRHLSGLQLIDHAAALRPDASMSVTSATKTALRELGRRARYLGEQMDRLSALLGPLVAATAPALVARPASGPTPSAPCSWPPATTPTGFAARPRSPIFAAAPRSRPHRGRSPDTGSTAAVTAVPTTPSGASSWCEWCPILTLAPTSSGARRRASPSGRSCDA